MICVIEEEPDLPCMSPPSPPTRTARAELRKQPHGTRRHSHRGRVSLQTNENESTFSSRQNGGDISLRMSAALCYKDDLLAERDKWLEKLSGTEHMKKARLRRDEDATIDVTREEVDKLHAELGTRAAFSFIESTKRNICSHSRLASKGNGFGGVEAENAELLETNERMHHQVLRLCEMLTAEPIEGLLSLRDHYRDVRTKKIAESEMYKFLLA